MHTVENGEPGPVLKVLKPGGAGECVIHQIREGLQAAAANPKLKGRLTWHGSPCGYSGTHSVNDEPRRCFGEATESRIAFSTIPLSVLPNQCGNDAKPRETTRNHAMPCETMSRQAIANRARPTRLRSMPHGFVALQRCVRHYLARVASAAACWHAAAIRSRPVVHRSDVQTGPLTPL